MLLLTLKHITRYSFYGLTTFALSFFVSLMTRLEQYHPVWSSPQTLLYVVAAIVSVAIIAALARTQIAAARPAYRAATGS